ncbi:3754_t:CDS:2 [Racocetra fulgida]|uniref:3754_t:CDS:1 n=1 Tax=Racocetra fulgida TaxID=60492 RepID=A0A9N9EP01_9GLOM|nr:3754_t:CDS:2 [Racocetra fulgida]
MTLRLPEDILKEIFENLEDETGSLFSSILVNRLWCLNVIPILWKNPLKNQFKKASENLLTCQHRCKLLLRTLLSCLSDESRGLLSENRLELPFQISQRALFDYPMHCKNLRTSDVSMLVWSAVERKQISGQRGKFLFFVLEQELYKLFFSRSSAIQQFTLCSMLHSIQLFSGATSSLANLSVLRCSTESHESFFFGLAQICERIKVIIVDFCDKDNDEDQCPNLNIALQTQAHSLKKLDIIDNMGGILLNTIYGISDDVVNNLRNAEIPNLETLEVRGEPISLKLEHLFLLDEEEGLEMFLKSRSIKMPLILEVVGNLISQDTSEIISIYRFNGVLKDAKLLCFGEDSAPDQQTPRWKIDAII